jgi:hypothetical protein
VAQTTTKRFFFSGRPNLGRVANPARGVRNGGLRALRFQRGRDGLGSRRAYLGRDEPWGGPRHDRRGGGFVAEHRGNVERAVARAAQNGKAAKQALPKYLSACSSLVLPEAPMTKTRQFEGTAALRSSRMDADSARDRDATRR